MSTLYTWDVEARAVLVLGARCLILGDPGTGKSSLLVDAAVMSHLVSVLNRNRFCCLLVLAGSVYRRAAR
ncbi:hypothetical protein [Mycobacterium leprae]|uniref:hypothetical protein n=1 Tax=Mycobacterium leprae TaxID=1769 RepID=UPI0002FF164D